MRVLWIGKAPGDGEAGDEVFDRQTIAALRRGGHAVDVLHPAPAPRWREAANLLRGLPHYRTRFGTPGNRRLAEAARSGHDVAICSWEPLDVLVPHLQQPTILIAHNVTSLALPQLFPGSIVAGLAARRAAAWEAGLYRRGRLAAIAALSRRDRDHLAKLPDAPPVLLTVPGMPPVVPLHPGAGVRQELVLSGTYGWRPKRRDVVRFAREYAASAGALPVLAGPLPPEAAAALHIGPLPSPAEAGQAIRFGLVTDRFEAGHKLKTLAYIAQNQVVLSFSDAAHDVADVPDHDFFIRRIGSAAEVAGHVSTVAACDPSELRTRLQAFQRRCAERFTWDGVADRLVAAARDAA